MNANKPLNMSDVGASRFDSCTQRAVCRFQDGELSVRLDSVIQEAFYELVVNGRVWRELTCSPWNVRELAVGSLFTSGVVACVQDIISASVDERAARVEVRLASGLSAEGSDLLPGTASALVEGGFELAPEAILERIALLENGSDLFHRTGGVHTAALAGADGIEAWFEDVGRHNALDKLAGWCVLNGVDVSHKVLLFSGRVPHEIIVKVARLGCPMVISPSAPTSYSIEYAQRYGITLVGFAKNGHFNAYSHAERIGRPGASAC